MKINNIKDKKTILFEMEPLSYDYGDLEPVLSTNQVKYHYKHHTKSYFDKLNDMMNAANFKSTTDLKEVVQNKLMYPDEQLWNQAAQALNHTFMWKCLTPKNQSGNPSATLTQAIIDEFGSVSQFKSNLVEDGMSCFGSGWVWLVLQNDKLHIEVTSNSKTPFSSKKCTPLLCIDLWEHGYLYDPQYAARSSKISREHMEDCQLVVCKSKFRAGCQT